MAGFNDLIAFAQPALIELDARATEGVDWQFDITGFNDRNGDPIDLSSVAGVTTVCKIVTKVGGSVVATLNPIGGLGTLQVSLPAADTVGLANGELARSCRWYCRMTKDGKKVQVWNAIASNFRIEPEEI